MCGLEEDPDEVWRTIEGRSAGGPEDAAHWVRVYRELVTTSEAMLNDLRRAGDDGPNLAGLDRRVAVFRNRLRYWTAELAGTAQPER